MERTRKNVHFRLAKLILADCRDISFEQAKNRAEIYIVMIEHALEDYKWKKENK